MNKSVTPPKQSPTKQKKNERNTSSANRSPNKKNGLTDIEVEEKLRHNR